MAAGLFITAVGAVVGAAAKGLSASAAARERDRDRRTRQRESELDRSQRGLSMLRDNVYGAQQRANTQIFNKALMKSAMYHLTGG